MLTNCSTLNYLILFVIVKESTFKGHSSFLKEIIWRIRNQCLELWVNLRLTFTVRQEIWSIRWDTTTNTTKKLQSLGHDYAWRMHLQYRINSITWTNYYYHLLERKAKNDQMNLPKSYEYKQSCLFLLLLGYASWST